VKHVLQNVKNMHNMEWIIAVNVQKLVENAPKNAGKWQRNLKRVVILYATPDSKLLYVADQGELLGRPVSNEVYVIDIPNAKVISTIKVGKKAHGVVVSNDGKSVFVTNTIDNTVSVIDVASQKVIHTIPVGKGPNGISYWFESGGMP